MEGQQKQSATVLTPWYPPFIRQESPCPPCRIVALRQTFVRRCHCPEPAAYWQFSGLLHFEPAARVGQKAPRTCRKRGAGPLSDRKSQSIVRLSKDQGGSSVFLDTSVVNCLFNRRQYYFVIGPIPVFLCPGRGLTLARRSCRSCSSRWPFPP